MVDPSSNLQYGKAPAEPYMPGRVFSLVSQKHGMAVPRLFQQIAQLGSATITCIVVTPRMPVEQPGGCAWRLVLVFQYDHRPLGFEANHNSALGNPAEDFSCVLSLDVELSRDSRGRSVASYSQPCQRRAYFELLLADGCVGAYSIGGAAPGLWALFKCLDRTETRVDGGESCTYGLASGSLAAGSWI